MAEVKAKKAFSFHDDESGRPVVVKRGQIFDARHPVVAGREDYFEPVEPAKAVEPVKRGPGRPPKTSK